MVHAEIEEVRRLIKKKEKSFFNEDSHNILVRIIIYDLLFSPIALETSTVFFF